MPNFARAQGTAFTFQGQFLNGGVAANGVYPVAFTLYTNSAGGTAVKGPLTNNVTFANNGLFTVTLDFGANVFEGASNWLEIAIITNGSPMILSPRQQLTPTPYAIFAPNAGTAQTAASATAVAAGVTVTGTFIGNGAGMTNLKASNVTGTIADSMLSSNVPLLTVPNTNVTATATVVLINGFIEGLTNLNGGSGYTTNEIPNAWVMDPTGSGSGAWITLAVTNGAVTGYTVQSPGSGYSSATTVTIDPPPSSSFETFNSAVTMTNGDNVFAGDGGGLTNLDAYELTGVVPNSALPSFQYPYQTIGGGLENSINPYNDAFAVIGGGFENGITSGCTNSVICGGLGNYMNPGSPSSVIGGGNYNTDNGVGATIGGGLENYTGQISTTCYAPTVGGGCGNVATNHYATVPGGYYNVAGGYYSFAAGAYAEALAPGSFVWSDGTAATGSAGPNSFVARASGGFVFLTSSGETSGSGAKLAAGSGSWSSLSDRNAKNDLAPVNPQAVLAGVAALPISKWSYKTEAGVRHLGPMAQDFRAAFQVGEDDTSISTVDEEGVALAAIQGLNQKVEAQAREIKSKDDEIQKLKEQSDAFEQRLNELQKLVQSAIKSQAQ